MWLLHVPLRRGNLVRTACAGAVHDSPPYVEGQFEPSNQDTLVKLACTVAECMFAFRTGQSLSSVARELIHTSVGVETAVLLPVVVWWIVFIEA